MIHKWSAANGRSMAMSDIFVPRHLLEHCSAYLRGVPPAAPISTMNRESWPVGLPEIIQRSAEEEQEQGECWELGMRRPGTTEESRCFKQSWSIELEHENSSRKPNSMNNRFCGVNMILNDFDIKILGSDSDTSWIRGYEFDMVWNMSLIYVFWHGFGCNIDVFLIWHRT